MLAVITTAEEVGFNAVTTPLSLTSTDSSSLDVYVILPSLFVLLATLV